MKKIIEITLVLSLLSIPLFAFSQLRSVAMVLQLKDTGVDSPLLYYMINDTVVYDLGKGKDGVFDICLPGNRVNDSAAFVIQSERLWIKIATVRQLENNTVCKSGTVSLTLLEIERIKQGDPESQKEYKTPPRPHQPTLLVDDHYYDNNPLLHADFLQLVALSKEDSLYCSEWVPKKAFDGTYYLDYPIIKHPRAHCVEKTMDSLQLELFDYYLDCERQENIELVINRLTFVVDEKGLTRGAYCFVKKDQQEQAKKIAIKILHRFKNERFSPAINVETGKPVPDLMEFFISKRHSAPN